MATELTIRIPDVTTEPEALAKEFETQVTIPFNNAFVDFHNVLGEDYFSFDEDYDYANYEIAHAVLRAIFTETDDLCVNVMFYANGQAKWSPTENCPEGMNQEMTSTWEEIYKKMVEFINQEMDKLVKTIDMREKLSRSVAELLK